MAKKFLVSSNYFDMSPRGLEDAIDRCLNYIAGQWLTTDFEIDATVITNSSDGPRMVAVIATMNVLPVEPHEQKSEGSAKEVGMLSCGSCSWTGSLDDLSCPLCETGGGVNAKNDDEKEKA